MLGFYLYLSLETHTEKIENTVIINFLTEYVQLTDNKI